MVRLFNREQRLRKGEWLIQTGIFDLKNNIQQDYWLFNTNIIIANLFLEHITRSLIKNI